MERVERTRLLYRVILCSLLFTFAWTQSGCEKDLADLPVSDSLSLEWGDSDSEFVTSEPILSIPLKKTKITKKTRKLLIMGGATLAFVMIAYVIIDD